MSEEQGADLTWVHIKVASDAVFRNGLTLCASKQLASSAAAGMLRSRARRVTRPDGSEPVYDFGELPEAFWADSLEYITGLTPGTRHQWSGDENWDVGTVEGMLGADRGSGEPMHIKAHGVQFCAQDLVELYSFAPHVEDALLKGKAPAAFAPLDVPRAASLAAAPPLPAAPAAHSSAPSNGPLAAVENMPTRNPGGKPSAKHGEPIATVTIALLALPHDRFARENGDTVQHLLREAYSAIGVAPPSPNNLEGIAHGVLRAVRSERQSQTPPY